MSEYSENPDPNKHTAAGELFELLINTDSLAEFLQELVILAANTIDEDLSAGLTTQTDHRPVTVAASDAFAAGLDELQYTHGHGPCLQAMKTGTTVEILNLAREKHQWGDYGIHAFAHGLAAVLSVPLPGAGKIWGALNLYSRTPEKFTPTDRARAASIATQAGTALAVAARIAEKTALSEQLQAALASRAKIDQAIGIIMGAQRCSPAAAFEILRQASSHRNTKVHDIAAGIVASTYR